MKKKRKINIAKKLRINIKEKRQQENMNVEEKRKIERKER